MKLIAHRGLSALAPENTIKAFELAAAEESFYGIECDIHESKDGQFIVFHDDDLKRMAKSNQKVEDLTYDELSRFEIVSGSKVKQYPHQSIPRLSDFLTICEESKKAAIIEIKKINDIEHLNDLLTLFDHYPTLEIIVISFNLNYLKYIRALSDIPLQYLTDKITEELIYDLRVNKIDFSIQKDSFKPNQILKLKKKGFMVATFTVNKKSALKQLSSIGIDYVTTDKILK